MNSEFILAVHALVFLYHKKETLSSEALSENICTNPARVRRVMAKLGKAGLVETRIGRTDGGYSYQKESPITLGDIAEALGTNFAEVGWHSGDPHIECQIASGMAGYMDHLYHELDSICKKRLSQITVADVEKDLFKGSA